MSKSLLFVLFVFCFLQPLKSIEKISIEDKWYKVDHNLKFMLVNKSVSAIMNDVDGAIDKIILDTIYKFVHPISTIEKGILYPLVNEVNGSTYQLCFSELPVISLNTSGTITDEPRIPCKFTMSESDGTIIESNIGIELRGGFSQSFPKKSFRIEFWKDSIGLENTDISLLGMRKDDDWNLQAMYNEPLRLRNKTNHKLWKLMHTCYYSDIEPKAVNGIEMEYADVFLNGSYNGIYGVGERVDNKQLKIKDFDGQFRGELYKGISWGASTYDQLPEYDNNSLTWGGFQFQYPDEITDWSYIYNFVEFVIKSDDADFKNQISNKLQIENAIDYFIFLNLLRAGDNGGKNVYVAKYDSDQPYFFVPWDLDGTFGTAWNGVKDTVTVGLLSNGIYKRMLKDYSLNGFREQINGRWSDLRSTIIQSALLIDMLKSNYYLLKTNGVYEREKLVWKEFDEDNNHFAYVENWVNNRISNLDKLFGYSTTEYKAAKSTTEVFSIYPNPTTDVLYVRSNGSQINEITVLNSMGQILLSSNYFDQKISLAGFPNGIYYLKITGNNATELHKFMIKN